MFGPLELLDVETLADAVEEQWFNQTLVRVNDCVVRPGIVQGAFHWHKHDEEDRTVELAPKQGFTVPKGIVHRTRAPERTGILMVEGAGVAPPGDPSPEQ